MFCIISYSYHFVDGGTVVKKILVLSLLLFATNCFGTELNESQKKILRYYPNWSNEERIRYFHEFANYYSESCPQTLDQMTTLLSVRSYLERPGLIYTAKLSWEKAVQSQSKWDDMFNDIETKIRNGLCSHPDNLFFRKIGNMMMVYDYYDKRNVFLKRIIVDLETACLSEKNQPEFFKTSSVKSITNKYWSDEDYIWFGNLVTAFAKTLKGNPTKDDLENSLMQLPNSKPYINKGKYQGQIIFVDNKEFLFIYFNYTDNHASVANLCSPPIKRSRLFKMYDLFHGALSKIFIETKVNVFDVGDGFYAFLDQDDNSYSIQILRAKKSVAQ